MSRAYKNVEGEIRTDKHRANFFVLLQKDVDKLIKPHREEFEHIRCPNCDHGGILHAFQKGEEEAYICPSITAYSQFFKGSGARIRKIA